MVMSVGRSMCEDKDRPLPLPTVDPIVTVEHGNRDVIPATTAEDRSGSLEDLVSDRTALHGDVAGALPTIAPLGDDPIHGVVRPSNESVQRHRYVPNDAAHRLSHPRIPTR